MDTDSEAGVIKPRGERAVVEFVALRTAQVCVPAVLGLAAARRGMGERRSRWLSRLVGVGLTAGLTAYFQAVFDHRTTWGYPLTTRLPDSCGIAVALTFDDGPHPETTPALLEILARHDARATFFLVGERVRRYPDLARRIVEAGHTVGNHSLRHRAMVASSPKQVARELDEATRLLEDATGVPLRRLLRPPHGFKTPTLCRTVTRLGWELVAWSLDPRDYDASAPDVVVRRSLSARRGDILLLHERPGAGTTQAALPHILEGLRRSGLEGVAL